MLKLPNEVIFKILDCFDIEEYDDVLEILKLRRTCHALDDLVLSHSIPRHKGLKFRLCGSLENAKSRIRSFRDSKASEFKARFSTLVLYSDIICSAERKGQEESEEDLKAWIGRNAVDVLVAAAPLIRTLGPQLGGVELIAPMRPRELWLMDADEMLDDRFFRVAAALFLYAGTRNLLPNLKRIKTLSSPCHVLRYIAHSTYVEALEERMDAAGDGSGDGLEADEVLSSEITSRFDRWGTDNHASWWLEQGGPQKRMRLSILDTVEDFYVSNRALSHWGYNRLDFNYFDHLITTEFPKLSNFTFSTQWRYAGSQADGTYMRRSRLSVRHSNGYLETRENIVRLGTVLTTLELVDCQVLSWAQYWGRQPSKAIMCRILDGLLPMAPKLRSIKVEWMVYKKGFLASDEAGMTSRTKESPWKKRLRIVPDGTLATGFGRPMVSPFPEDLQSLFRLRDEMIARRKELGLPSLDPWLKFVSDYDDVGRVVSLEEILY